MSIAIFGSRPPPLYLRTCMYVDVSNFIGEFRNLLMIGEFKDDVRYVKLAEFLASSLHSVFARSAMSIRGARLVPFRMYCYGSYTGAERGAFSAFKERLKSLGDVELYLIERSKCEREKGVDVRLATDMLVHAAWNNYDVAILVSGDADFEPVVRRVRDLGKKVYISFFPYAIAEALKEASDGLMSSLFHAETLASKPLAVTIINEFKNEFFDSIHSLVEELETKNYLKPLLKLRDIKKHVEVVKEGIHSSDLQTIMKSLESLHKLVSASYPRLREAIPYKHYTRLSFKLMFSKELIKWYIQQ